WICIMSHWQAANGSPDAAAPPVIGASTLAQRIPRRRFVAARVPVTTEPAVGTRTSAAHATIPIVIRSFLIPISFAAGRERSAQNGLHSRGWMSRGLYAPAGRESSGALIDLEDRGDELVERLRLGHERARARLERGCAGEPVRVAAE